MRNLSCSLWTNSKLMISLIIAANIGNFFKNLNRCHIEKIRLRIF